MHRAKLGEGGVYWGVEEVEALGAEDVEVPRDCDLRPGAYRWNAVERHFDPLPAHQVRTQEEKPSLEQAVAELVDIVGRGAELTPRVKTWREEFAKTVDALGAKK